MFMPGPLELIIILGVLGLLVVVVVVVIAVSVSTKRRSDFPSGSNPNLAPCPDCGRLISIRATTCPHCGGPVKGVK